MVFQPRLLVCIPVDTRQALTIWHLTTQRKPASNSVQTIYPDGVKLNQESECRAIVLTADALKAQVLQIFQIPDEFLSLIP